MHKPTDRISGHVIFGVVVRRVWGGKYAEWMLDFEGYIWQTLVTFARPPNHMYEDERGQRRAETETEVVTKACRVRTSFRNRGDTKLVETSLALQERALTDVWFSGVRGEDEGMGRRGGKRGVISIRIEQEVCERVEIGRSGEEKVRFCGNFWYLSMLGEVDLWLLGEVGCSL